MTGLASTTDIYRIRVTRAGTLQNLVVMQNTPSTASGTVTYTVNVNGVSSALTVTIAGNVTTGQDFVHTVSVNQGDQLTLQVTKTASVSPAVSQVIVTVELQ
jgi:hypothetical protein